jgi:general stress protein 26
MNTCKSKLNVLFISLTVLISISMQVNAQLTFPRDTIIAAATEIINDSKFCGLATFDSSGMIHMRTMNPFPANKEFITWFATSRNSRKVKEIKDNPNVCVYYANHSSGKGYVSITGTAEIIDDKELLISMKRAYWEGIPNWQNIFVLIKIKPKTMNVINYPRGLSNAPDTNRTPSIEF